MPRSTPSPIGLPHSTESGSSISGDNVRISGFRAPDGSFTWKLRFDHDGIAEREPAARRCVVVPLAGRVYYLTDRGSIEPLRQGQRLHVAAD